MTVVGTYDSDQQKIFFTKPVDIASDVDITGPALNITGDVNLSGNLTVGGSSPGGDIVVAAGSEYFQTVLTSDQTNIHNVYGANEDWTVVDFEGLGTQTGDTSNWDGTNNAYELKSTGLYQLSFSLYNAGLHLDGSNGESSYKNWFMTAYMEASADNFSTSTVLFGGHTHMGEIPSSNSTKINRGILTQQYLYSPTSANTKVRLVANSYVIDNNIYTVYGILKHKLPSYAAGGGSKTISPQFFNVVRLH